MLSISLRCARLRGQACLEVREALARALEGEAERREARGSGTRPLRTQSRYGQLHSAAFLDTQSKFGIETPEFQCRVSDCFIASAPLLSAFHPATRTPAASFRASTSASSRARRRLRSRSSDSKRSSPCRDERLSQGQGFHLHCWRKHTAPK